MLHSSLHITISQIHPFILSLTASCSATNRFSIVFTALTNTIHYLDIVSQNQQERRQQHLQLNRAQLRMIAKKRKKQLQMVRKRRKKTRIVLARQRQNQTTLHLQQLKKRSRLLIKLFHPKLLRNQRE